jgi:hypothetical protein
MGKKLAEIEKSGVEAGAPRNDWREGAKYHTNRGLKWFVTKRPIQFGEVL